MSQVMERPITGSATLYPQASPILETQDAEDFYQHGAHGGARRAVTITAMDSGAGTRSMSLALYMESEINRLLALDQGWDGDHAAPVTEDAVFAVVAVMSRLAMEFWVLPFVFPLIDGGLQLEWHADRQSVEIEVSGHGDAHVIATDESGRIELNSELSGDDDPSIEPTQEAIRRLTTRLWRAR